jgi:hypothetical protein
MQRHTTLSVTRYSLGSLIQESACPAVAPAARGVSPLIQDSEGGGWCCCVEGCRHGYKAAEHCPSSPPAAPLLATCSDSPLSKAVKLALPIRPTCFDFPLSTGPPPSYQPTWLSFTPHPSPHPPVHAHSSPSISMPIHPLPFSWPMAQPRTRLHHESRRI